MAKSILNSFFFFFFFLKQKYIGYIYVYIDLAKIKKIKKIKKTQSKNSFQSSDSPLIKLLEKEFQNIGKGTNRRTKGLISADRDTKVHSRTYNTPFSKNLSRIQRICPSQYFWNLRSAQVCQSFSGTARALQVMILGSAASAMPILTHVILGKLESPYFSMDSGLEAFSRNPTHGSFSAMTFQSTEFANYANQRFLSY